MSSERYPLHAAERLRNAQRVEAEHALARAQAERARAQAEVAHAEQRLAAHLAAALSGANDVVESTSALELQRAAAFAQRHALQARALREQLTGARARASERALVLHAAQRELAQARAGEQAIDHDRTRFEGAQRREREQAEQGEVDEQVGQTRLPQTRKDRGH